MSPIFVWIYCSASATFFWIEKVRAHLAAETWRSGHHIATLRDLLVLGLPGPTTGNKNLVAGRRAPGSEEAKW
jgi:hypothetical protein